MQENIKLKLSPPWVTYVNKLIALFGQDPEITIKVVENGIKIYVDNEEKALLLTKWLPFGKDFGNYALSITVYPPNSIADEQNLPSKLKLAAEIENLPIDRQFDLVFAKNPVYSFSHRVEGLFFNDVVYVVFKNEVVQFFNDNLNDIYGNVSTLYENLAREIFEYIPNNQVVFFCTDIKDESLRGERQWP